VFLDALFVKMRHEGRVENRAVYVAIGINLEGRKDVLGLWTSSSEGAKFWMNVLTEPRCARCVSVQRGWFEGIPSSH
jgi:putative transposase